MNAEGNNLISLVSINGLVKGPNLTKNQHEHIDGWGINIIALHVQKCGPQGYNFIMFKVLTIFSASPKQQRRFLDK